MTLSFQAAFYVAGKITEGKSTMFYSHDFCCELKKGVSVFFHAEKESSD